MTRIAWCAVVGVMARLAVAWGAADAGVFADMVQYDERARHLATTGALWPDALRGPGYPALLALAYRLAGDSLWTARVANALVGGALVLLTGVLARAAGAGTRAWVASAMVAVYPSLVLSSVYLMPEGLYALLVVTALVAVRHRAAGFAVAAGAVTGLAMLTRSVGLALCAAPVAVWLRARSARSDVAPRSGVRAAGPSRAQGEVGWRVLAGRIALFAAACGLVLAPWLFFTSRVAGGPLLDATSGVNLLLGNNPRATGRLELGDEASLRKAYVGGASSPAEGNARAIAAGVSWATSHPRTWARLAVTKVAYLFGLEGREHAWVYGHSYFGARPAWMVTAWGLVVIASFPLLCVAVALGVVRAPRPASPALVAIGATVLATTALHVVSFAESRFHLPLVPLLAVVASLSVEARRVTGPRAVRVVVTAAALAALVMAWSGQWPELRASLGRLRATDGWTSKPPY